MQYEPYTSMQIFCMQHFKLFKTKIFWGLEIENKSSDTQYLLSFQEFSGKKNSEVQFSDLH